MCIEHTKQQTGADLRERLARDPALRERQRISKRASATRHRPPAAPRGDITLREAATLLGVCHQRVAQWQTNGTLPKPLTRASVEQLVQERTDAEPPAPAPPLASSAANAVPAAQCVDRAPRVASS